MAAEGSGYATPCVPKFDGDYDHWSLIMENLLRSKEYWSVIQDGIKEGKEAEALSAAQQKVNDEAKMKDLKAKNYLFQSIDKSILKTITQKSTAKQLWDSMKIKYQGNARVQRANLQRLRRTFETLEMKPGESVADYFGRVMSVSNDMRNNGESVDDEKIVEKVLRTLTDNFNYVVCSIEESKDINKLSVDELQSTLLVHEQKVRKSVTDEHVLQVNYENYSARGRGRGSNARGGSNNGNRGQGRGKVVNRETVECYKCRKLGHFIAECPTWEKRVNFVESNVESNKEEDMLWMAYAEQENTEMDEAWFLDSGCSNHMTSNKEWFSEIDESFQSTVKLGNNTRMQVKGIGSIRLEIEGITQTIGKVYYVPDLTNNLLSIGQLQEKGVHILFKDGFCKVYHPDRGLIVNTKMRINRMFLVFAHKKATPSATCYKVEDDNKLQLWHRRFGHLNQRYIQAMQSKQLVTGLPLLKGDVGICEICNVGKQHREWIQKRSKFRATKRLQLVHADLCGPISPPSYSKKRYALVFVDDFSRKGWIYFLCEKNEAFTLFKSFKIMVEKETGAAISCLRTDRGGEFTSSSFNSFCEEQGIKRQLTASYTPQQNGIAERRNRTILNMVRCLLNDRAVPKTFWPEAAKWTTYILNRSYTPSVENMVPEECWSGIKPSVEHLRIFGCVAHVHIPKQKRVKLDDRSHKCVMLGVSDESKAYRLFDPVTKKIVISKDVIFEENERWNWNLSPEEKKDDVFAWGDDIEADLDQTIEEDGEGTIPLTSSSSSESSLSTDLISSSPTSHENISSIEDQQQIGPRSRKEPVWMRDFVSGEGISEEENEDAAAFFTSLDDPTSYSEAVKDQKWRDAMNNEIEAIEKNKTWELVNLPANARSIGVKWVFKTKLNEDGKIDKCKARLVVKGYSQKKGVDYTEVFAPVARWDTIRIMLAIAAQSGWKVFQLDVKSAFLYGELKEVVYVDQPEGYVKVGEENKVYRLKKALYGLKQAPRAWFSRIEGYFTRVGLERSSHDHTLFIMKTDGKLLMVSLYVDDLLYTGSDELLCKEFKCSMNREFEMTDLGEMRYFLGVEVRQNSKGIHLCQSKYAKEVLERFNMWNCNAAKNPIVPGTKLSREGDDSKVDSTIYKQLVGCLMYLTVTRPDIMFVVCLISRFMAHPMEEHLMIAKRVLRYLKGTLNYGLFYKRECGLGLKAYTDSDYASDINDRKSTSGYVFLLSGAAVCWSSRKQAIVTLSSTEAEYVAAVACACHCVWVRAVLIQLGYSKGDCIEIMCDNTSSIKLSKNPVMHRRTKHIDVKFHYLRELTCQEIVKLVFCGTREQVADIMTKPLTLEVFCKLRGMLGVQARDY
ncbi:unnamed protein product [Rhodiola kirilowii]